MEVIIANPTAGRGYAHEGAEILRAALEERNIAHQLWYTQCVGHATELARRAAGEGARVVWVVGGDATVCETAEGLLGGEVPMGVIPCGTGNDLCRVLDIPARKPVEAYDVQQGGMRTMDVWMANDHIFLNVAGLGFDSETLWNTRRFRRLPGSMLPYMIGVLVTIVTHKNLSMRVEIGGESVQGELLLLSLANGQFFGGGMRVAPDATLEDGMLDVIMIRPVPKWRIPFLLPKFLRGAHIDLPITTVRRADALRIQCEGTFVYQLDGELREASELSVARCERKLLLRGLSRV